MGRLSFIEKIILLLISVILIIGYILFYSDVARFENYVREDGVVEWLTVLGLILGCIVCISRFFQLRRRRTAWFLIVTIGFGLLLFFAAGEEISWGQRIFGIKSSEFFKEQNSQGETNFHNLKIGKVKLNKVIFSFGLSIAMGIYLLVFPILYKYHKGTKQFINRSGIPLPRLYQIICMLLIFVITSLLPHEKKAELLEAGFALLFFLIIKYPGNPFIFNPSTDPAKAP